MGTPMYHPIDVWVPCPPSAAPPGDETFRGISPTGGSEPTFQTQTEAPLEPLTHKTSLPFSYPLTHLLKYSPAVPISPHPPDIPFHCRPVAVGVRKCLTQIPEQINRLQCCTI